MPRTPEQTSHTDRLAAELGYVAPPPELEPTGKIYEDATWTRLVDWFDAHIAEPHGWRTATLVYISRRWDTPVQDVYANTDDWAGMQFKRLDIRDDPDAELTYGN